MIASLAYRRTAAGTRLRRLLDRVEAVLRGPDDIEEPAPLELTTRELLLPHTDEPASLRARRQAADYLERRRQHLRDQLQDR